MVIRSADIVVSGSGESGTLSEMAIGWQKEKSIAALKGSGGWSDKLADTTLDRRGESTVMGCDTVEDVVAWAARIRPEGVNAGGLTVISILLKCQHCIAYPRELLLTGLFQNWENLQIIIVS